MSSHAEKPGLYNKTSFMCQCLWDTDPDSLTFDTMKRQFKVESNCTHASWTVRK